MTEAAQGRMLLLMVGIATFFFMGGLQAVYGPALPVLAREMQVSLAEVSVLFTVHWVGSAGGVAAMFLLGNRMTPRRLLLALLTGAVLLGAGLGWGATLAGAFMAGLGQGCAAVVFNPRLLAAFGARGPAMLNLINAVFGAGAILAPLAFVAVGGAYGLVFLALALAFALTLIRARDVCRVEVPVGGAPLRPDFTILTLGAFGIGFEASLIGLGPAALVRAGATEVHAAGLLSAFFVTFLIARVVMTLVAHMIGSFAQYVLSVAGVALTMAGAVVLPPDWLFVLSGAFAATIFPAYFVEGVARMGSGPRVAPLIIAGGLVGGIGMPFVLARVTEGLGPRGFFLVLAVMATAVVIGALASRVLNRGAEASRA